MREMENIKRVVKKETTKELLGMAVHFTKHSARLTRLAVEEKEVSKKMLLLAIKHENLKWVLTINDELRERKEEVEELDKMRLSYFK